MSGNEKRPLVPRLRFPEFREAPEWGRNKLEELITTVSPPSKLQSSSYGTQGKFPIIDQSQELICGWTDDESAVITESLPLIVFGDHTCALKFVDKPFAQGADGIKILKAKPAISAEYLFHSLSHRPLAMEDYKRHFSILKERAVVFPDIKSGEQQKIADCLSSLDALITAENQRLDALKTHKKGLMQRLFPSEGETVPRLRFPAFRKAGKWQKRKVSDLLVRAVSPVSVDVDHAYQEIGIRSHGKGIFHKEPISGKALGDKRVFRVEENAFVVNIVFAWEQAVAVTSAAEKEMIASHRFPMYKPKNNSSDVHFIKYFFLTNKGKELLGIASPGGAGRNKTLGQKEFENLDLLFPGDVEEQTEIANILSSLDDLIATQSKKVDALKTHKHGLMQQLFPALDAV